MRTCQLALLATLCLNACTQLDVRPLPTVSPENSARVTVYRVHKFYLGGAVDVGINIDKSTIGVLRNGEYSTFRLNPGTYHLELYAGRPVASAFLHAQPGQSYCYWFKASSLPGPKDNDLNPVPCDEMAKMMAGSKGSILN